MSIDREHTCLTCGGRIIPAGKSNLIAGVRYYGLPELADENWVVCEICYEQDPQTGNWKHKGY